MTWSLPLFQWSMALVPTLSIEKGRKHLVWMAKPKAFCLQVGTYLRGPWKVVGASGGRNSGLRPSFEKDIVSIESRIGCQFQVKVKHKKTVTSKLHILSRAQNPGWYSLPMASDHVACDLERYLLLQTLHYCYISYAYSFFDLVVFLFKLLQGSALCLNTAFLFHLFSIEKHSPSNPPLLSFHGCAYCLSLTHRDSHYCWPYSISPSYLYALLDQSQ